jgi:hypothetical protein
MIPLRSHRRDEGRPAPPDGEQQPETEAEVVPATADASDDASRRSLFQRVALFQGAYYFLTGAWSLVSIGSFQRLTGPKTDLWLVKTVGALVSVVGVTLALSSSRRRPTMEATMVGGGSALALGAVEAIYVAQRRISPIYLLDAVVQFTLVALWYVIALQDNDRSRSRRPQPHQAAVF